MINYEAKAYVYVALEQLKEENKDITWDNLRGRVLHLIEIHTAKEINNLYNEVFHEISINLERNDDKK